MVHNGVADAEVSTFDSVANSVLALDSGRVDATAIDLSTGQYLTLQNPDKYKVGVDSWQPQTYALAVKPGDQRWLNWVNTALHEYLVGLDFLVLPGGVQRALRRRCCRRRRPGSRSSTSSFASGRDTVPAALSRGAPRP